MQLLTIRVTDNFLLPHFHDLLLLLNQAMMVHLILTLFLTLLISRPDNFISTNISDTPIVSGMSGHEAVLFTIHPKAKLLHTKLDHKIFLYCKGTLMEINDMAKLNNIINTVELLKTTEIISSHLCLIYSVSKHIPQNPSNPSMIYSGSIMG